MRRTGARGGDRQAHAVSPDDVRFREAFDAAEIAPSAFDHRAHVRLAYVYLVQHGLEDARERMRTSLQRFLHRHGIDPAKYHETLTTAWMLAVRHFMSRAEPARSAEEFIERNPRLLESGIMLTHYSAARLFSEAGRAEFVHPDLEPIPDP